MRDDVLRSAALKALHDPAYDALWSAAEDLDFSIGIHEGGDSGMPTVGIDRLLIEEQILGSQQGMGGIGGSAHVRGSVSAETMSYEEARPGGLTRTSASRTWISTASTPPFSTRAWASSPAQFTIRNRRVRCRAYNRWLADYCKPYPDRLFGIAMLPMQSIDHAIAEMRFARKNLGFRGGFIRPQPLQQPHGSLPSLSMTSFGARSRNAGSM